MLTVLFWICFRVCKHNESNKMNATNLGVVFGPALFRCDTDAVQLQNINAQNCSSTLYVALRLVCLPSFLTDGCRDPCSFSPSTAHGQLFLLFSFGYVLVINVLMWFSFAVETMIEHHEKIFCRADKTPSVSKHASTSSRPPSVRDLLSSSFVFFS
jgi:hypothetical protein